MLKFFRKIRQNLLSDGKTGTYLKYAIGETLLIVLGILIALQINNWNEARNERKLEKQNLKLLITDLKEKKKEHLSDITIMNGALETAHKILKDWTDENKIDTSYIKNILQYLAYDVTFFNENSPIYSGLANSNLWKQLPDSLTIQIDDVYRVRFKRVSFAHQRLSEYAKSCKMDFLRPNSLIDLGKSIESISENLSKVDKEFIQYTELLLNSSTRLNSRLKGSLAEIDKLIVNVEYYVNTLK